MQCHKNYICHCVLKLGVLVNTDGIMDSAQCQDIPVHNLVASAMRLRFGHR